MQCGACCATFRVAFYWGEAGDAEQGLVPAELTRKIDYHRVSMIGTDTPSPRCLALSGDIGTSVHCTIYPQRPSPCRDFQPYDTDGNVNARCNSARARWHLPPLDRLLLPAADHASPVDPAVALDEIALPNSAVPLTSVAPQIDTAIDGPVPDAIPGLHQVSSRVQQSG